MSTQVGRLGEDCVEHWLAKLGWECCERNMRIPGGEIDRLFIRNRAEKSAFLDVCVAEIKTTHVRSLAEFRRLFTEAHLRALIRPHQVRNLWRTAAYQEGRLRHLRKNAQIQTYVRYFLVVTATARLVKLVRTDFRTTGGNFPVKLCRVGERELIFAWSPDVPAQFL